MRNKSVIFRYKTNKGLLHKVPALIKLFLLLPLSIICMSLPVQWLATGIGIAIIAAFLCRFTVWEQLTDLKPALYYAFLMYILSVFSNIFEIIRSSPFSFFPASQTRFPFSLLTAHFSFLTSHFSLLLLPDLEFLRISLRLTLIIQLSSLLFRTTSSLEIRESLCKINKRLGENISLFLSFIPQIFENWSTINLAWKARGGKNGLRKIKTVVFVLISLCMEKAAVKAKALEARKMGC